MNIYIFQIKLSLMKIFLYNFTKDIKKIKFVIKFQKLSASRVIYLYGISKNVNYRLILKTFWKLIYINNICQIDITVNVLKM